MEDKTFGQIAFETYSNFMGGKTYDDKPIPKWDEVGDKVKKGWDRAALAVIRKHQEEIACVLGLMMNDAQTRKS